MSAFKVTDRHIHVIAAAACLTPYFGYVWRGEERHLGKADLDRVCALLVTENDRSLHHRYPRGYESLGANLSESNLRFPDESEARVELMEKPDTGGYARGLHFFEGTPPVVGRATYDVPQIYQAVRCYMYQACEHDEWKRSEAYAICLALCETLGHEIICSSGLLKATKWSLD